MVIDTIDALDLTHRFLDLTPTKTNQDATESQLQPFTLPFSLELNNRYL